jgi:hypothetical protein
MKILKLLIVVFTNIFSLPLWAAQGNQPTQRQEELAAALLIDKGDAALPTLAWGSLSLTEQAKIKTIERSEIAAFKKTQDLENDLRALLGAEPLSNTVTIDQQFRFSKKVRDEMVGRLSSLLNLSNDKSLNEKLETIAHSQPTFDPRFDRDFFERPLNLVKDRVIRLAELFVFGMKRATLKKLEGDEFAAKQYSAGALRALIEAYLTAGVTSGSQRELLHRGVMVDFTGFVLAILVAPVVYHQNGIVGSQYAAGLIYLGIILGLLRDVYVRDNQNGDSQGSPSQPILLPSRVRTGYLRKDAGHLLNMFWRVVTSKVVDLRFENGIDPRVLGLLSVAEVSKAEFLHPDVTELERWALNSLVAVSGDTISEVFARSCENKLVPTSSL